ncbi:MAG: hypothetical protein CMJ18_25740 [Phycisphaeraceae bacterium]|nr:hypothetical protein [Phycisphaeraceae bacterium]
MVFTGTYEHTVDKKNRLSIPADLRVQVQSEQARHRARKFADLAVPPDPEALSAPPVFFILPGESKALYLYTEKDVEQRAEDLIDSEVETEELLLYERMWFSAARRVELDGAGRITIPGDLRKDVNLESEVVLLGVHDHLEVRNRQDWYDYKKQILTEQPQLMMDPRRMKRHSGRGA